MQVSHTHLTPRLDDSEREHHSYAPMTSIRSSPPPKAEAFPASPSQDTTISEAAASFENESLSYHEAAAHRIYDALKAHGGYLLADEMGIDVVPVAMWAILLWIIFEDHPRVLVVCRCSRFPSWHDACGARRLSGGMLQRGHELRQGFYAATYEEAALGTKGFDLVVIDEAHRLAQTLSVSGTVANRLACAIGGVPRLLLAANPYVHDLRDVHALLHLVAPGAAGSWSEFKAHYEQADDADEEASRVHRFRERFAPYLGRTLATDADALPRVGFGCFTVLVESTRYDEELHQQAALFEASFGFGERPGIVQSGALSAATSSSARATQELLFRMRRRPLPPHVIQASYRVYNAVLRHRASGKDSALLALLRTLKGRKTVVFVAFNATALHLETLLKAAGISATTLLGETYRPENRRNVEAWQLAHPERATGHLETDARQLRIHALAGEADVLITTDRAAEGFNLSTASVVVGYDVPWTPLSLEQRARALLRFEQSLDVLAVNLVLADHPRERRRLRAIVRKHEEGRRLLGASREVLGEIVLGIDAPRRIESWLASGAAHTTQHHATETSRPKPPRLQPSPRRRSRLFVRLGHGAARRAVNAARRRVAQLWRAQ